jgi:hypothetical protein
VTLYDKIFITFKINSLSIYNQSKNHKKQELCGQKTKFFNGKPGDTHTHTHIYIYIYTHTDGWMDGLDR